MAYPGSVWKGNKKAKLDDPTKATGSGSGGARSGGRYNEQDKWPTMALAYANQACYSGGTINPTESPKEYCDAVEAIYDRFYAMLEKHK